MLFQMAPWVRYGLEALAYLESLPDRLPEATILEDAPAINGIQIKELLGQPVPDREGSWPSGGSAGGSSDRAPRRPGRAGNARMAGSPRTARRSVRCRSTSTNATAVAAG